MNVWFVNHYAHPPTEAGGTRHHSLAKFLGERGHRASVIAASFDHFGRATNRVPWGRRLVSKDIDGVQWLWLRTPSYRKNNMARMANMLVFGGRLPAGFPRLVELLGPPDVVVGSTPHPFGAAGAARVAKRAGAPFVLEVRDLWPETLVQLGGMSRSNPAIRYLARMERRLFRSADRIVTLLPHSLEYISAHGGESSKISWLPNGVDLSMVPEPKPRDGNRTFSVVYAGAHGLSNVLDRLLDAARLLPPSGIRIHLVGEGPEKERLIERARTERINNITFEDSVTKQKIYERLQEADAFALILEDVSLYRWGMSVNKLFDYMVCGRPVIVASNADYDPVEEADAGMRVRNSDPESLAEAITRLAQTSAEEQHAMGARGRDYVKRHHDLRAIATQFELVLDEAVNFNPEGPTPRVDG